MSQDTQMEEDKNVEAPSIKKEKNEWLMVKSGTYKDLHAEIKSMYSIKQHGANRSNLSKIGHCKTKIAGLNV